VTPENVETQSWVAKTVWQRISGRRARKSKTPATVQSTTRHTINYRWLERLVLTTGDEVY